MKILAVFVAVILTTLKDASSCFYRNNLPPLRCIPDPIVIPGPACAPSRCSKMITTHKNLPCPSTIGPNRVCSHNPIIIPGPCCGVSRPSYRPACVKKEIVNRITVNNCCGSEDEVFPRFDRFIPNSCSTRCHYDCEDGPIITHSCGSKASINKVAVQNVIVKNVHANDRCGSVHIAPPLCSSCVSDVGPHYHCDDRPIIRSCGCETPINKVTVRNVIVKNIQANDCHCVQPAPPLCTPCISNPAPRFHCAVPPIITRGCGCEAPINKVTVRNVIVKDIPVNECKIPAPPLCSPCISNPIPHCHFPDQPVVRRGCGCDPPINMVGVRNVNVKQIPKCDCCVQYPPPRCSNIIVRAPCRAHQGAPCIPNTCPERCCSPKPTVFIPEPTCKVPVRTVIVQPNCCCQRDRCCDLNSKNCCDNPCVQCDYCCEQNCCYRKHSCKQCCAKCSNNKCQLPCYNCNCCKSGPCCCKGPVRTIIVQPDCCGQRDRCCDLNSKRYCDKPCSSCDNCCEQSCCYKKHCSEPCGCNCCRNKCQPSCNNGCSEQCCSKCYHNKCEPHCYKRGCCKNDPCCCNAPVRTIIVQPDCCCQKDRCCDLNSKCCCDKPCSSCDNCCNQNCCYKKHCSEPYCSNCCRNKCQPSCNNCCSEQCCSKCYRNKCEPHCYKRGCCKSDPCCCYAPVRTIIVQPDCCCQKDRCCDLNSKCCCDKPCSSCDNCCNQNCCYKKHCSEPCCSNCCRNKCQPSSNNCCCCESDPCCCNKKCCKCFFCKGYPCSCCQKNSKCPSCKKVKCCDSCCSKCHCCKNSKCCKSNCNFTPVTFSKPHHQCFERTSRVTPTIIAISRKC